MDRFRQKTKKEKLIKHHDKAKPQPFVADVKTTKENLKIKEILKTVKINSSMRIKAPRGSKVMSNRDLSEANEHDSNGESLTGESSAASLPSDNISITNSRTDTTRTVESSSDSENNFSVKIDCGDQHIDYSNDIEESIRSIDDVINDLTEELNRHDVKTLVESKQETKEQITNSSNSDYFDYKAKYSSHEAIPRIQVQADTLSCLPTINSIDKRTRKLSLDQTMLSRRPSLSQSELNLNSVGKSPLERKSSFFRKKMESFFKNTSEIFKRQSLSRSGGISGLPRRGSVSCSLQSLHDAVDTESATPYSSPSNSQELRVGNGSVSSLNSTSTMACSSSSYTGSRPGDVSPGPPSCLDSLSRSQPIARASQPLGEWSDSVQSLNEEYIQEQMRCSRAISMSSGLDSATGPKRRPSSLANRVTWLASEGLTNYLRRVIQDEKCKEIQVCHSFNEGALSGAAARADARGRRLSYQRAVSGEDPVRSPSGTASLRRRHVISEHHEANYELVGLLSDFTRNGIPPLKGFCLANIGEQAKAYLDWAEEASNLEDHYEWKTLHPDEEARQAVIKELVQTEVHYIRHLFSIVEVFIATAHALQDKGKLLDIDTERLFSNIPDILNANLVFWEVTFYPMLSEALEKKTIFNSEMMYFGFYRFRELFQPYERFVNEQNSILDYLRCLATNGDFMTYLSWCHSHKTLNRLTVPDMIVKPMQRLTKYALIIRRLVSLSDVEPMRTTLLAMELFAKNYVTDLNRSLRQKEELERLDSLNELIDVYDVDFKDEEMDKLFRAFSSLNLRAPMVGCPPIHSRCVVHEGDLRFKDHAKEVDVRAFLLTDMLLICKKGSGKGNSLPYKMYRPKYMLDRMSHNTVPNKNKPKEVMSIVFMMLDEVGTAYTCATLTEPSGCKDASYLLKMWDLKIKEAKMTYELGKEPLDDTEIEVETSSDCGIPRPVSQNRTSEEINIEKEARERVAVMLHGYMGASTEHDYSQASMYTDSIDAGDPSTSGGKPGKLSKKHQMKRNSTGGSSRNSRLDSFQKSTSAASHDEPQAGPSRNIYRAGSSTEHVIPPKHPNEEATSITVNVLSESESETIVPLQVFQPPSRRPSAAKRHTLMVQPQSGVMALVHSLPDLSLDPSPRTDRREIPMTASEKLYQQHHEKLNKNRLSARGHGHYLTPDHRGTSYPPPSPTRASLKRGLAFSYSCKNPRLSKMGHVYSQSQAQQEAGPSTSAGSSPKNKQEERGAINPLLVPSTSRDSPKHYQQDQANRLETKKSTKHVSSRRQSNRRQSPDEELHWA